MKSDLDEPMMRKIAEISHGQYFHADNRRALEQVFDDIDRKLPPMTEKTTGTNSVDMTPIFSIIFLMLLLLERQYWKYILQKYRLNTTTVR